MNFASTPSGTALILTSVFKALFLPKNVPRKTPSSESSLTNLQLPFYRKNKVLNLFKNRTVSSQLTRSNGKLLPVHQTDSTPPGYRERGLPIGSGQVEGVNKSVIGFRMKQSGMQWSRSGAGRMASLRARRCSKQLLVSHDTIRHHAFSSPTA